MPHDTVDPSCVVCRRPGRRRLIDADLGDGITSAAIAASMRDSGWALTAAQVTTHAAHATTKRRSAETRRRDAALTLKERMMDEVERRWDRAEQRAVDETAACEREEHEHDARVHDPSEYFNLLDKDLQPALGTIVKAQGQIEKREAREEGRKIELFKLMAGGADGAGLLAPADLRIDDGHTFEGDFTVIDDAPEA